MLTRTAETLAVPRARARRRSTLAAFVLISLASCKTARIEPFGETKLDALCEDTKRCETRGDSVVNLLKQSRSLRLYLAPDKGPEQLLGKVAPERKSDSVLKTCGAEITVSDWLVAPEALRQFNLGQHGKQELRARLLAYLSARTSALAISDAQTVDASLSAVIEAVALDRVSWVSQTYWLTDAAFERRVAQCGEEDRDNIIYSLTLLAPSQAFQVDLQQKLERALREKLGGRVENATATAAVSTSVEGGADAGLAAMPSETATEEDAGATAQRHDTLARDIVQALARDTRVVAALGFDDP